MWDQLLNVINDLIIMYFMESRFYIIALLVMLIRWPIPHSELGYRGGSRDIKAEAVIAWRKPCERSVNY